MLNRYVSELGETVTEYAICFDFCFCRIKFTTKANISGSRVTGECNLPSACSKNTVSFVTGTKLLFDWVVRVITMRRIIDKNQLLLLLQLKIVQHLWGF